MSGFLAGITRSRAVLALLGLGILVIFASGRPWLTVQAHTALDSGVVIYVRGTSAAPAAISAGFVIAAAALALSLAGRVARWVALGMAGAAGGLLLASALDVARNPHPAAIAAVTESTGVSDLSAPSDLSSGLTFSATLGVLVIIVSVVIALAARTWTRTARHDRAQHEAAVRDATAPDLTDPPEISDTPDIADTPGFLDPHSAWDALSRGSDPSRDPSSDPNGSSQRSEHPQRPLG
jgi:hypothetical protein